QAERPQSVAQLRSMLFRREPAAAPAGEGTRASAPLARPAVDQGRARDGAHNWPLLIGALLMIMAGVLGGLEFTRWHAGGEAAHEREAAARRQQAAEAKRQADFEAERRRLERERIAAEEAERRRAEAEERRKEEERRRQAEEERRIATREETPAPARAPRGQPIKVSAKLASLPIEGSKAWLGVAAEPLEPSLAQVLGLAQASGALVFNKTPGGPADQAGIHAGDVILGIDNRSIANAGELRQRLSALAPGSVALVDVWRAASEESDFLAILRGLAEGGDGHAMHRLGRMYAAGIGTSRDDAEAARWFRKGADGGNEDAAAALAIALLEGRGVAKDDAEGLRLLREAAGHAQIEAMNRLGNIVLEGK